MILIVGLVAGLAIGLLRKGSLRELGNVPVKFGGLAAIAFLLQILVIYFFPEQKVAPWGINASIMLFSYFLLLVTLVLNLSLKGTRLLLLGLLMNFMVMAANGGFMPVTPEALAESHFSQLAGNMESGTKLRSSKDILLRKDETRLWLLSDIFVIPPELPLRNVFSLGDVFLTLGSYYFIVSALTRNHRSKGSQYQSVGGNEYGILIK